MSDIVTVENTPQRFREAWLYVKGDIVYIELSTTSRYVGVATRSEGDGVYVRVWTGSGRLTAGNVRYLPKWVSVIGRIDEEWWESQ